MGFRSRSKLRPRNLLFGVALLGIWGVIEVGLSIHDHGWTFDRDLQMGLCWIVLGAILLIENIRKPTELPPMTNSPLEGSKK